MLAEMYGSWFWASVSIMIVLCVSSLCELYQKQRMISPMDTKDCGAKLSNPHRRLLKMLISYKVYIHILLSIHVSIYLD